MLKRSDFSFTIIGCVLSAAIFALDLATPPKFGLSVIPHLIAVVIAAGDQSRRGPWLVAGIAIVATLAGYLIKSPEPGMTLFLANRLSIVAMLIFMAFVAAKLITFREEAQARDAAEFAQAQIKESEGLVNSIIENVPVGFLIKDANHVVVRVNDTYLDWYGLDRDTVVGIPSHKILDFQTTEDAEAMYAQERETLAKGTTSTRIVERPFADNDIHTVSVTKFPIYDSAGRIVQVGSVTVDLSEQINAQRALETQEHLLASIIAELPVGLVVKDLENRRTLVNETNIRWYGHHPDDIMGKTFLEVYADVYDEAPLVVAQEDQVIATGETIYRETVRKLADGKDHHLHISKYPVRDKAGNITGTVSVSVDMTEQIEAQRALQEQEQLLSCIIDELPVGVVVKDRDNRRVLINQTNCTWYGRRAEDTVGKTYAEFFDPDDDEATLVLAQEQEVAATGIPTSRETIRRFADGTDHHLFISKYPVRDQAGDITGTLSVSVDMTDQIQARVALEAQERLLRSIIDNLPASLVVKDLEGRRTMVNATYLRWYAPPEALVIGGTHQDFRGTDDPETEIVTEQEKKVIETGETLSRETVRKFADGEDHHLNISKYPIYDPEGKVTMVGTVGVDQTEQVLARRAQTESEERFRDFAEVTADWMWEMDADLRFTYFSERSIAITGFDHSNFIGKTRRELAIDSLDQDKWRAHFDDLDNRRPFRNFEYSFHIADGGILTARISGKPVFDADGNFQGYRGTGTDISEQQRIQAARREALESAERANRAKSEFLATMSHEFRTPLNAILGFSDILANQYFGPPDADKYTEYAGDIHASAAHLLALVNDLLDISAIEAGKLDLNIEPLSVPELLADCTTTLGENATAKSIKLWTHASDTMQPLYADRRATKQVVLNILSNAVKFTPSGGQIEISASANDAGHEIRISDTGPGIPANRLQEIINPFTRGDDPYKTDKGWGLGLSITNSIVELHGGRLSIDSTVGQGTTVTVFFPHRIEAQAS